VQAADRHPRSLQLGEHPPDLRRQVRELIEEHDEQGEVADRERAGSDLGGTEQEHETGADVHEVEVHRVDRLGEHPVA
jgi:hypothetical protein